MNIDINERLRKLKPTTPEELILYGIYLRIDDLCNAIEKISQSDEENPDYTALTYAKCEPADEALPFTEEPEPQEPKQENNPSQVKKTPAKRRSAKRRTAKK